MTAVSDEQLFARFSANPPASDALIARSQASLKFQLPDGYVRFLRQMNGGEGPLGENAYLMLPRVEELEGMNELCQVSKIAPRTPLFRSNCTAASFSISTRSSPYPTIAVPCSPLGC